MLSVCITHEKPLIPEGWYEHTIALGGYLLGSEFHISKLNNYWHRSRELAYGAAGVYSVPDFIDRVGLPTDNLLRIFTLRKAVVAKPILCGDAPDGWIDVMHSTVARQISFEKIEPRNGSGFLVSRPIFFERGVVHQYSKVHHLVDILDYISLAIELKVLDTSLARQFLVFRHMIPGGAEVGVFPAAWVTEVHQKLGTLGQAFIERHRSRILTYDPYQVRAIGFLSERLGSFFVLKKLKELFPAGIPSTVFGRLVAISEDGNYSGGVADSNFTGANKYSSNPIVPSN